MTGFIMFLHAVLSILLIVIILMQSGRGGGLTEGFASAESLFGAKTNEFMIKATTIFSTLFLLTCLGLAILSSQRGKSLMADQAIPMQQVPITEAVEQAAQEVSTQVESMEERAASTEPFTEPPIEAAPSDEPVSAVSPIE